MINVHELETTNVSQKYFDETSIDIEFELKIGRFELHLKQDEKGVFRPYNIYHAHEDDCPYCDKFEMGCTGLKGYKNDFFCRLIEFPSIRLEWLYLPHNVQA